MSRASAILQELSSDSLLSLVPGLSELALERGSIQLFRAGDQIVSSGQVIEFLYIPLDAALKLSYPDGRTTYLQKRQSLSLREVLMGQPFNYSAETEATNRLLAIPLTDFRRLLESQPGVENYLRLMTSSASIRNFKRFLTDRGVEQAAVMQLIARLGTEATEYSPKVTLPADSLYFIRSGQIQVHGKEGKLSRFSIEIGEGAWFGGEGLVPANSSSYEAVSSTTCLIHRLSLVDAHPFMARYGLLEAMYDEPWIARVRSWESHSAEKFGKLTSLPGTLLDNEDVLEAGMGGASDGFQTARSDEESFLSSIYNLCKILNVPWSTLALDSTFTSDRRVSWLRIAQLLEPRGLQTRSRHTRIESLARHPLPLLIILGTRLVILTACLPRKGGFVIHDPARGWVRLSKAQLNDQWDGQVLEVECSQDLEPSTRPAYAFLARLKNHQGVFWNLLGLSTLAVILRAVVPWLSGLILDRVIGLKDGEGLAGPIIGMLLVATLGLIIKVGSKYIQGQFGMRFEEELSTAFYRHAVSLPVNRFSSQRTGDVISRIQASSSVQSFFSGSPLEALMGLLGTIFCLFLLAIYSVPLAISLFFVCAGLLTYHFYAQKKLVVELRSALALDARSQSLVGEQFASITAIKASGSESDMRLKWERVFLERVKLNQKCNHRYTPQCVNAIIFTYATEVAVTWAAGWIAFHRGGTIGEAVTITLLAAIAISPVRQLWNILVDCAQFQVAIGSLEELMSEALEQPAAESATKHPLSLKGKIRLEKVSYRYGPNSPWVIKDLSLTIYPKQIVAIVGVSGSGKTTLARLISGDLHPISGRIFFDDFDLNFLALADLRSQIGFVTQGNELFQGTIAENVSYADDIPDSDLIDQSIRLAQAEAFVKRKPEGSAHLLKEGGAGLSGGERQRLSIARTLYRQPKLLVLDEATSALDAASEKTLIEGLESTLRDRTVVVIAHRLSVIRRADRIIVVRNGEIVEEGTHTELATNRGAYSAMFQKQFQFEGI